MGKRKLRSEDFKMALGGLDPRKSEWEVWFHVPEEKRDLLTHESMFEDFEHSPLEITVADTLIPVTTTGLSNESIFIPTVLNPQGSAKQKFVGLVARGHYKLPHPSTGLALSYYLPVDLNEPDNYLVIREKIKKAGMEQLAQELKENHLAAVYSALRRNYHPKIPKKILDKFGL
jgi:hypothetical protein